MGYDFAEQATRLWRYLASLEKPILRRFSVIPKIWTILVCLLPQGRLDLLIACQSRIILGHVSELGWPVAREQKRLATSPSALHFGSVRDTLAFAHPFQIAQKSCDRGVADRHTFGRVEADTGVGQSVRALAPVSPP